jgi:hypothetical protein
MLDTAATSRGHQMTDVETQRFEEANQAGHQVLIRGAAGHPPPTGRST